VFVLGRPFQLSLMLVSKAKGLPKKWRNRKELHSGRVWPYSKTLDWVENACQGQTLWLIMNVSKLHPSNYIRKKLYNFGHRLFIVLALLANIRLK
jgi:hypothetical protein